MNRSIMRPIPAYEPIRTRWTLPFIVLGLLISQILVVAILITPDSTESEDNWIFALTGVISYTLTALGLWWMGVRRFARQQFLGAWPPRDQALHYLGLGIPMLCIAVVMLYALFYPLSFWFPEFVTWWLIEQPTILDWTESPLSPYTNAMTILLLVVLAPTVEEFIFRGFLLNRWIAKFGVWPGILLSSLLFSILHVDLFGTLIFSLVQCFIVLRTQSLFGPMLVHFSNNFLVLAWILSEGLWYGHELEATLVDFQTLWWITIPCAVVAVPWMWFFFYRIAPRLSPAEYSSSQ